MKNLLSLIVFIFFTIYSFSQETKVVEIIQAGTSIRNSSEYPGATILIKDDTKKEAACWVIDSLEHVLWV